MKIIGKAISCLLACCVLIASMPTYALALSTNELYSKQEAVAVASSSNRCGENLTWQYENHTLTISGTGDMTDWSAWEDTPWAILGDDIRQIIIEKGVTSIGSYAFSGCPNLERVYFPESVTKVSVRGLNNNNHFSILYEGYLYEWERIDKVVNGENTSISPSAYSYMNRYFVDPIIYNDSSDTDVKPSEGFELSNEQLAHVKHALGIPEGLDVQVSIGDRITYWDAAGMWLVDISFYYNGEMVAGALFNADTLELGRNITMYSGDTDIYETAEDAEFRLYLNTASNCIANGSSTEMYAGLFVDDNLYTNSAEGSYDISVSDSRVVRITADGWSDTLGQLYRLEALQPGSVTVTITDTQAGVSGTLDLRIADSEMVYTFDSVPEMTIEDGKTTNFYDFSGLVVDGFQYTERADGHYDVNMTIYNTLDLYAAVTAYDKDGNIYDYDVVDKFKSMDSSFVDSVSSLIKETGDLFYLLGNERYYSGESISEKTDISIKVPKGGYLEITNNAQSVVPLIANATGIMVDFIVSYGDLALDVGKTLDKKWIAEQVLEDAFSKDYLKSAMVSAIQDTAKDELMNGNWSVTGFRDGIQSFFDALTSAGFNLMESITRKTASAAGIASITESAVMNIIPTGHLIDLLYSGSDVGELVIETMAFLKSFERPTGIYIQPEGFTDISTDAYYYDAVQWAVDQEITAGTSDLTFGPDDACTRSQAVTFLWRAAGSPEPSYSGVQFSDVQGSAYYYDAALWAIDQEITFGVQSTSFAPDASCNRAQIATFIYRAAGSPETQAVNSFSDVEDDVYYTDAINWVTEQGIATGTSETTFSPNEPCTRAQIVTFLYRANEKGIF